MYLPIFVLAFALAKGENGVSLIKFGEPSTVSIKEDQLFKVSLDALTSNSEYPSLISIYSKLLDDGVKTSVNIVAVNGSNSESWVLNSGSERNVVFCVNRKSEFDHINIIVQINNVNGNNNLEHQIMFNITEHMAALSIPNEEFSFTVTDEMPTTFLVQSARPNSTRDESFVFKFKDVGDEFKNACALVTFQPRGCPLKNHEGNFEASNIYATMLEKLTLTVRTDDYRSNMNKFSEPFYVNIFLHSNPTYCVSGHDPEAPRSATNREKRMSVQIETGPRYRTYILPIGVAVLFISILIGISCCVICTKSYDDGKKCADNNTPATCEAIPMDNIHRQVENAEDNGYVLEVADYPQEPDESFGLSTVEQRDETDGNSKTNDFVKKCIKKVRLRANARRSRPPEYSAQDSTDAAERSEMAPNGIRSDRSESEDGRVKRVKIGLNRLQENATLDCMSSILRDDPWFRRNRSRVYCYIIPLTGMFYFIPAIQFTYLAKNNEARTGSLDLCFHNFGCAHPFSVFADFNHIVSNISFVAFGLAFIVLVKIKAYKLSSTHFMNHQNERRGIIQQLGIFYAMGFALILQALFSICYHVCPTNKSLQFDTTMMYIICVLCYIKIYQFRHPDATPNAYSVVSMIGILVLLEASTIHSPSWFYFGMFILFYLAMTVFIAFDCYYIGIGRLDWSIATELAKEILCFSGSFKEWFSFKYPSRFFFYVLFCLANFLYAAYTVLEKLKKPNKTVSHVVLVILGGNLMLYLFYYLVRKSCFGRRPNKQRSECVKCMHKRKIGPFTIYIPFTSGSFFGFLGFVFGVLGLYYYQQRNANRNLSPSESRNLNDECSFMRFYDNHDMWHFFGAAGIFMAFLALLTVDDDLLNVPIEDIDVF